MPTPLTCELYFQNSSKSNPLPPKKPTNKRRKPKTRFASYRAIIPEGNTYIGENGMLVGTPKGDQSCRGSGFIYLTNNASIPMTAFAFSYSLHRALSDTFKGKNFGFQS